MKRYLYFTVFVSGMTTLAAELAASRLIGNVFGTSNLVWASIIGLILIYLTAGYFIGGRWADRWPDAATLYRVPGLGAFTLGVVPYIATPVLRFAAKAFEELDVAVLLGSFLGVLILFCIPVTLLGMISPFAISIERGRSQKRRHDLRCDLRHIHARFIYRDIPSGAGHHPHHRHAPDLLIIQSRLIARGFDWIGQIC